MISNTREDKLNLKTSFSYFLNAISNYIEYHEDNSEEMLYDTNTIEYFLKNLKFTDKNSDGIVLCKPESKLNYHDFILKIFLYTYLPEMDKYFRRHHIYQKFYDKYIKDSIKLARSNDFLDHSSLDAFILPLETAFYEYYNENFMHSNEFKIDTPFKKYNYKFLVYLRNIIKFKKLTASQLKDNTKKVTVLSKFSIYDCIFNSDKKFHIDTKAKNYIQDFFTADMYRYAFHLLIIKFFIKDFSSKKSIIKDQNFIDLKADVNLFFSSRSTSFVISKDFLNETHVSINNIGNIPIEEFKSSLNRLQEFVIKNSKQDITSAKAVLNSIDSLMKITEDDYKFYKSRIDRNEPLKYNESVNNILKYIENSVRYMSYIIGFKNSFIVSDLVLNQIKTRLECVKGRSYLLPDFCKHIINY